MIVDSIIAKEMINKINSKKTKDFPAVCRIPRRGATIIITRNLFTNFRHFFTIHNCFLRLSKQLFNIWIRFLLFVITNRNTHIDHDERRIECQQTSYEPKKSSYREIYCCWWRISRILIWSKTIIRQIMEMERNGFYLKIIH